MFRWGWRVSSDSAVGRMAIGSTFFSARGAKRFSVHAYCSDGEAKYWLEPRLNLLTITSSVVKQLRDIEALIDEHYEEIVDAWRNHFDN